MSLVSGLVHAVGDVAAPIAKGIGAAGSLGGLLPNQTATEWTNIGNAISNPNVTLQYPGNIFNSQSAFGAVQQPQVQNSGTNTSQVTNNAPTKLTTTNNPTTTTTGANWDAYNAAYNSNINNLNDQINAIPAYQNSAVQSVYDQYNPQQSALDVQHQSGLSNLQLAQNQLDTQKSQGIRNLGNSLRSALNGYQNQIGVMGAGNSSAAPLIGYALQQQGNRTLGDLNTQYGQQQTGINQQQSDLEANYQAQKQSLDGWKQSQLNAIASQYAQAQQQLQQQILGAQGDEARYLAQYGQTALANQAIQQMQNLQSQYADTVGALNSHYAQVNAPAADISQYTGQPTITPFSQQQLNPLQLQNNQATSDYSLGAPSLSKKPDQSPNLGY